MSNCKMCKAPLPARRRKFCSANCTSKYHTYNDVSFYTKPKLNDKLSKKLKTIYGDEPVYGG